MLRAGETHQAIAHWLVRENPTFGNSGSEPAVHSRVVSIVKLFETQCQEEDVLHGIDSDKAEIPWTNVTTNRKFIGHLLDLYFTWVHPVHMLFSETEFKKDFEDRRQRRCSASLLNAICAMACNLVGTENVIHPETETDMATLRHGFRAEARRHLLPETYSLITSIQTFAVMYLVELSSGRAQSATGYLRSAIDNLKPFNSLRYSEEAEELTFWGIRTMHTYVRFRSLLTFI